MSANSNYSINCLFFDRFIITYTFFFLMVLLHKLKKEITDTEDLAGLIKNIRDVAMAHYHTMEREEAHFYRFMKEYQDIFGHVNHHLLGQNERIAGLDNGLQNFMYRLIYSPTEIDSPLIHLKSDVECYILVTMDSGLVGGFDKTIVRTALEHNEGKEKPIHYVVIGERGASQLSNDVTDFKFFEGCDKHDPDISQKAKEVMDYIFQQTMEGKIGRSYIVSPYGETFSSMHHINVVNLLPCELLGKTHDTVKNGGTERMLFESSPEDAINYLVKQWLYLKLYESLKDTKLSEYAARYTQTSKGSDSLDERSDELVIQHRKAMGKKADNDSIARSTFIKVRERKEKQRRKRLSSS